MPDKELHLFCAEGKAQVCGCSRRASSSQACWKHTCRYDANREHRHRQSHLLPLCTPLLRLHASAANWVQCLLQRELEMAPRQAMQTTCNRK